MAHGHIVINTDSKFTIDLKTRSITQTSGKNKLMVGDHNSEQYEFQMPRINDGHDMTLCDLVRVNYINISSERKGESKGPYIVTDLRVDPDDPEKVIFSWLLSKNCTEYAGSLNFNITFMCTTDSGVVYAWNTDVFKGITVSNGIDNEPAEEEHDVYIDVLETWKDEVLSSILGGVVDGKY